MIQVLRSLFVFSVLLVAIALVPTTANAQCNGVFGANSVCGSTGGGPPNQAFKVGTTGHVLPFLDGNNTFSGNNVFSGTNNFTGTDTFITQLLGDSTTKAATTAFVQNVIGQSGVYTPVQFGATCNAVTTLLANMPDDTAHLQAALDFVGAHNALLELGTCTYKITSTLTISNPFSGIIGVGNQVSNIVCQPTADGPCLVLRAPGTAVLYKPLLYNFGIHSADTTHTKAAFELVDVSEAFFAQLGSYKWTNGSGTIGGYFSGGTGSVCFSIFGRELTRFWTSSCAGDYPIVINTNPNSADISLDSWEFKDIYLLANGHPDITMQTGLCITNLWFDGTQNWIGGTDGLQWIDTTSTCASQGLYISGIKAEQAPLSTGWSVIVQVNNRLENLRVSDSIIGDRQGVNVRKVQNTVLSNTSVLTPGVIGYDVDGTAGIVQTFRLIGNFFQTGVLCNATNINNNLAMGVNPNASAQCLSDGFYGTSAALASINNVTYPNLYTSGGIPYASAAGVISSSAALTNHALVVGGGAGASPATPVGLGTTTTLLHGNAAGNPSFTAVSLTADVTGILPLANGGTGGITLNQIVIGQGASPATGLGSLGTTITVLHGNAAGAPSFAAVSLTADVSGILPTANGGTAGLTLNQLIVGQGAGVAAVPLGSLGTTTTVLHGNAAGVPSFGAVSLTADISGILPLANGGTGANLNATGGTSQFLKQASAGATITVVRPACADLSDGGNGGCPMTYAAGSWTPALTTDGTAGTPAYSIQVGSYEHIGREWVTRFNIALSGWTDSPTGNVYLAGLPHANNATTNDWGDCTVTYWATGAAVVTITGLVKESATAAPLFRATAAATGLAQLTVAELSVGSLTGYCIYHE